MRIALIGASGQLGSALLPLLEPEHEVARFSWPQCDIGDYACTVNELVGLRPDLVLHLAAHTDVDGCERDPETAYRVNALGTRHVALACQRVGCPMLYVSTDYVFDGTKGEPYLEFDQPNPLNVYGASKLAGERELRALLPQHYIVRTSWLFGLHGHNFVRTISRLARERDQLTVVTDQVGCPTLAEDLAEAIVRLVAHPAYGTYHLTNAGHCSWHDFASEIVALAGLQTPVLPVTSEQFVRPARRPAFSVLRNFCAATSLGLTLRPWQEALRDFFARSEG